MVSCPFTLFYLTAVFSSIGPVKPSWGQWMACLNLLAVTLIGGIRYSTLLPKRGNKALIKISWLQMGLIGLALCYVGIQLLDINVAPVWDAGLYYHALLKGVFAYDFTLPSFLLDFSAYRHPSQLLMLLYAPGQYIFPGKVWALNGTTLLLSLAMFYAYYKLGLKLLSPKGAVGATGLFMVLPSILALLPGLIRILGCCLAWFFCCTVIAITIRYLRFLVCCYYCFVKNLGFCCALVLGWVLCYLR